MNTITIELCAEDRARLDKILAGLIGLQHDCNKCVESALSAMKDSIEPVAPTTPIEPTEPAPAEPVEAPKAQKFKIPDIQKKVVELSAAGKKDQVREIVKTYAPKVGAIPEDKCDEVMAKLTALEG